MAIGSILNLPSTINQKVSNGWNRLPSAVRKTVTVACFLLGTLGAFHFGALAQFRMAKFAATGNNLKYAAAIEAKICAAAMGALATYSGGAMGGATAGLGYVLGRAAAVAKLNS